jgi:hypothetical protein
MKMTGELWQECSKSGCEVDPVCAVCGYCGRHCTCPAEADTSEADYEQALREQYATTDPLDVPIEILTSWVWAPLSRDERSRVIDKVIAQDGGGYGPKDLIVRLLDGSQVTCDGKRLRIAGIH